MRYDMWYGIYVCDIGDICDDDVKGKLQCTYIFIFIYIFFFFSKKI